MIWYTALPTPMNVTFNSMPPKTIPGKLTITWELVSNDTLNVTQVYNILLNTSNCGMCPTTTTSNFIMCNLTESNVQLDVCTVSVIIQDIMECDIIKNVTGEFDLKGE